MQSQRVAAPAWRYAPAVAVSLCTMLEVLDATIVNVALPHIMGSLGATVDEVAWVSIGYLIANLVMLPLAGRLSQRLGRRRVLLGGVALFVASSIGCASAPHIAALVAWRLLQGLAGGALLATAQASLYELYDGPALGPALSVFGLCIMLGPTLGPTLGGWITDAWSWPWIFWVNLPAGLLAFWLVARCVPDQGARARDQSLDLPGWLLLAGVIVSVTLLLERGPRLGWWESTEVLAWALAAVMAATGFVLQERRCAAPLVDLSLLADRHFASSLPFTVVLAGAIYANAFLFSLYVQTLVGFSAWDTATVLVTGALANAAGHVLMGRISVQVLAHPRSFLGAGFALFALGMALHAGFTTQSGWSDFWLARVLLGLGMAVSFMPLNHLALGLLERSRVAGAAGVYQLLRQWGGSLGVVLATVLVVQGTAQSRSDLAAPLDRASPVAQQQLETLTQAQAPRAAAEGQAEQRALVLVARRVDAQAAMRAYERAFAWLALASAALLPAVLLIRRRSG